MGQWIVGVISFQKIFGLCGLKGHIVKIRWDVTLEDGRTAECEDRARILKQNSQFTEIRGATKKQHSVNNEFWVPKLKLVEDNPIGYIEFEFRASNPKIGQVLFFRDGSFFFKI